jgi:hypothetical protein
MVFHFLGWIVLDGSPVKTGSFNDDLLRCTNTVSSSSVQLILSLFTVCTDYDGYNYLDWVSHE